MIPTSLLLLLAAAPIRLYEGGRPHCAVIVPAGADDRVKAAGDELARYLGQLGGRAPVVAPAPPDGLLPIRVGRREDPEGRSKEAVLITVRTDGIAIGGPTDRAVYFAVYRFLEQLGCRWVAPTIDHVPSLPDLAIEPGETISRPAFDVRTFVGRIPERAEWGMKVGLNGFYTHEAAARYGALELGAQTHTYHQFIPTDRWYPTHPEWFPLIGGERKAGGVHAGQLCVTAPGVADAIGAAVNALIDADPSLEYVSISPNDGSQWCECPACLALDERLSGDRMADLGLGAPRKYVGDRVFWFANQVARRVAPKHPGVKLLCLAYINYAEPPQTVVLEPNVVPWLCHYAPADYSRPIADVSSAPNAMFDGLLRAWAQRNPNLLYYGYVSKSMWWRLPRPVLHNFAADLRHLHDLGVHRYYAQSSLQDWVLDGPLYYVLAHLMWAPDADVDALAAEWRGLMYGPAGREVDAFDAAMEVAVKATGQSYSDNPPRDVPGLFEAAKLDEADRHLAAAVAAADGQEPYQARLADVERLFRYGREVVACLEAAQAFAEHPDPALLAAARAHGEAAQQYGRHSEVRKFVDSLARQSQLGVVASGLGEAEQKGGRTCWNSDETGLGDGAAGWFWFLMQVNPAKPVVIEMDVWGESTTSSISVNTGGQGLGTKSGGVWTAIQPDLALSGKPEWQTLRYAIPVEALAAGRTGQRVGMGGGDSQIWLAGIRVKQ